MPALPEPHQRRTGSSSRASEAVQGDVGAGQKGPEARQIGAEAVQHGPEALQNAAEARQTRAEARQITPEALPNGSGGPPERYWSKVSPPPKAFRQPRKHVKCVRKHIRLERKHARTLRKHIRAARKQIRAGWKRVAGKRNFLSLYKPLADAWRHYDNAGEEPLLLASSEHP